VKAIFPALAASLAAFVSSSWAEEAVLKRSASFEVYAGIWRTMPTGTKVSATASGSQWKAVTEDGCTALLPSDALVFPAAPAPKPATAKPPAAPPKIIPPAPSPTPEDDAPDLTTLSGRVYQHARVSAVEPDGITYMFAGGVAKIPFTELPELVRQQYGYDPQKAAKFATEDEQKQAAAFQAAQQLHNAEQQRKREQEIARSSPHAMDPQKSKNTR
jgi:hypothetical protein